jgi:hypothetical protein
MEGVLPVVVISPPGIDRAYALPKRLGELGFTRVTSVGVGPEVLDDPAVGGRVDQRGARIHSGGPLSPEQVACLVSHEIAVTSAPDASWVVVLEDDAAVSQSLADLARVLASWNPPGATIVSLFSLGRIVPAMGRSSSINLGRFTLRKLLCPPASAVGYAFNRSAADVVRASHVLGSPIFTRADWPSWSVNVDFFLAHPFVVGHQAGESTMPSTRNSPRGAPRVARGMGKLLGIPFLVHPRSFHSDPRLFLRYSWFPSVAFHLENGRSSVASWLQRWVAALR